MLTSEKVTFDAVSKRLTYESLLTNRSRGLLNPMSVGLAADSSDPRPAFRFKCSSPRIEGSFRLPRQIAPVMLWVAESLSITIDVRPNAPQGPEDGISDRSAFPSGRRPEVAFPATRRDGAVAGTRTATGSDGRSWWQSPSVLCVTAAVITTAVLASNVVTWGADAEIDPAALGFAASLLRQASPR